MGSIYNRYLVLKNRDNRYKYLFKCGSFYIFLDDDATDVSKVTTLKLTKYNNEICKCGFPIRSLDIYMNLFRNLGLNVKLDEGINTNELNRYLDKIRDIDLGSLSPKDSLDILYKLKELL